MDDRRFDDLTRLLGAGSTRRGGLRAALGGLLGLAAGAATLEADGKGKDRPNRRDRAGAARRRHECGPDAPCPAGFDCVKQGRKRRCSCSTGVTCDGACCPTGQVCQGGACVVPATCIAPGEPCKGVGKPCCDGRTCASGQGGQTDIACYVHKTGACQSTADCVYGTACLDGRCAFDVPPPAATGASCDPTVGQQCADPAAVCTPYTGPGAPAGAYCTLPLEYTCTGDPDCTCYKCDWTLQGISAGAEREARAAAGAPRLACCGPVGFACTSDRNCCLGSICVNGACQSETVCDVCASGCPYTTIKDAYDDAARFPAGSTITIAPGDYQTGGTIVNGNNARDITFRRCGTEGAVNIESNSNTMVRIQGASAPFSVAVASLEFFGPESVFEVWGGSDANRLQIAAVDCVFRDSSGRYPRLKVKQYTDAFIAGSTFRDIASSSSSSGAVIEFDNGSTSFVPPSLMKVVASRFTGNRSTYNGGAAKVAFGAVMEVTGSEFIDNQASEDGGAIYMTNQGRLIAHDTVFSGNRSGASQQGGAIYLDNNSPTVHFSGTTSVTGNAAAGGSGIWCDNTTANCAGKITGTTTANVSGNGPGADCQTTSGPVSCTTWS